MPWHKQTELVTPIISYVSFNDFLKGFHTSFSVSCIVFFFFFQDFNLEILQYTQTKPNRFCSHIDADDLNITLWKLS